MLITSDSCQPQPVGYRPVHRACVHTGIWEHLRLSHVPLRQGGQVLGVAVVEPVLVHEQAGQGQTHS